MTESSEAASRPAGYVQPIATWLVECRNPKETEVGTDVMQLGPFTSEAEANRLLAVAPRRYHWATDFRINVVTVHHSFEDWEWDR